MLRRVVLVPLALAMVAACGKVSDELLLDSGEPDSGLASSGAPDASVADAATGFDAGAVAEAGLPDAAPAVLTPCPTAGVGAFAVPGVTCVNFTPIATGAAASGQNASDPHYALRAVGAAPSTLVLFFVGSTGKPAGVLKADPATNLYAAAVADGRAVLGLSYANDASIGSLCKHDDACFFPTRQSIILGTAVAGSAATITPDESIVDRAARALRYLASGDPTGGWAGFLTTLDPAADAASSLVWSKILVAGHSQGGGHAAAIGKLFPVARVVQLSSTCDNTGDAVASWTDGTAGTWASDPTNFFGLAAPSGTDPFGTPTGDQTCPFHTQSWTSFGMKKKNRNNGAAICGDTGDTHDESLRCTDNYDAWVGLFQ